MPHIMTIELKGYFLRSILHRSDLDEDDEDSYSELSISRPPGSDEFFIMFEFLNAIADVPPRALRKDVRVIFENEEAVGLGPLRECIGIVSRNMFPNSICFAPCPDGTTVHFNLNMTEFNSETIKYFF